ncbi:replicase-associated polyprotein [Japanese holly fern mottle virus]|uniref:Replicase-associated polyprotein n=1 Tax=Japanese holly fern mottle virus TaxID=659660 RepID=C7T4Z4_9VIRU|nr:unnamed protein product [Japanese holly fern mottle virus]ACT67464.1 replicase-associated polyprotein [Japanese holly fern mottle virus]
MDKLLSLFTIPSVFLSALTDTGGFCYLNCFDVSLYPGRIFDILAAQFAMLSTAMSVKRHVGEYKFLLTGKELKEIVIRHGNMRIRSFRVVYSTSERCVCHIDKSTGALIDAAWLNDNDLFGADVPQFNLGSLPQVKAVDYLEPGSLQFEQVRGSVIRRAVADDDSNVSASLRADYLEKLRQAELVRQSLRKVRVVRSISPDQLATLRSLFPGFEFEYTPRYDGPHNMAAVIRTAETLEAVLSFPKDEPLIDIGGDFFFHVRNGFTHVHCCAPILDSRDDERFSKRCMHLQKWVIDKQVSAYSSMSRRVKATLKEIPNLELLCDRLREFNDACRTPDDNGMDCSMFCHRTFQSSFETVEDSSSVPFEDAVVSGSFAVSPWDVETQVGRRLAGGKFPPKKTFDDLADVAVNWVTEGVNSVVSSLKKERSGDISCDSSCVEEGAPEGVSVASASVASDESVRRTVSCGRRARFGIMIHSSYDMLPVPVCQGMVEHDMTMVKGCMIAEPAMLVQTKGYLPILECNWRLVTPLGVPLTCHPCKLGDRFYRLSTTGDRPLSCPGFDDVFIEYHFQDDSTMAYRHKFSTVFEWMTCHIVECDGARFCLERDKFRDGSLYFTITRLRFPSLRSELNFSCAWLSSMASHYVLKVPMFRSFRYKGFLRHSYFDEYVVSKTLVDTVFSACLRSLYTFEPKDHRKNFQVVITYLASHSQSIIINGTAVTRREPLPAEWLNPIAMAIYYQLCVVKDDESQALLNIDNCQITKIFHFSNFVSALKDIVTSFLKFVLPSKLFEKFSDISNVGDFINNNMRVSTVYEYVASVSSIRHTSDFSDVVVHDVEQFREVNVAALNWADEAEVADLMPADLKEESAVCAEVSFDPSMVDEYTVSTAPKAVDPVGPLPPVSSDAKSIVEASVLEYLDLLSQDYNNLWNKMHSFLRNVCADVRLLPNYCMDPSDWGVYCLRKGEGWLLKPDHFNHAVAFCAAGFISVDVEKGVPRPTAKASSKYHDKIGDYLVFCSDSKLINGFYIYDKYKSRSFSLNATSFNMVDGVAGCGKTYEITNFVRNCDKKCLVVSPIKTSIEDLRENLPSVDRRYLRTIDSYLLNPNVEVDVLVVDEAYSTMPGAVMLVASCCKAKELRVYGDTEQIPYAIRVPTFEQRFPFLGDLVKWKVSLREDTRRCPQDVVEAVNLMGLYKKKKFRSLSKVTSSMSLQEVHSVNDIPLIKGALYISQTQKDVAMLMTRWKKILGEKRDKGKGKKPLVTVSTLEEYLTTTVHGAQGSTYTDVVYFRLSKNSCDLYEMSRCYYSLVAVTRHTGQFTYCSVVPDDPKDVVAKLCKLSRGSSVANADIPGEELIVDAPNLVVCDVPVVVKPTRISDRALEIVEMNNPSCSHHMPVGHVDLDVKIPHLNDEPGVSGLAAIGDLIEAFYPGNTAVDTEIQQDAIEFSDLSLSLDRCRVDLSRRSSVVAPGIHFSPVLKTGALERVRPSQTMSILAYESRNANVPLTSENIDIENLSTVAVEKFFSECVDESRLSNLSPFVVGVAADAAQQYLDVVGDKIPKPSNLSFASCNKFSHMVKQTRKPCSDTSVQTEFKRPATITYHGKDITQVASPVFRQLTDRLLAVLMPNICVPICDNHDMAQWVANRFSSIGVYKSIEIDISQMDKSQMELHQLIQDKVFLRLGADPEFIFKWKEAHRLCHMAEASVGFAFTTSWQRRTGDAATLLGNSVVTLVVNNYVLGFKNFVAVGCVGDDFSGLYTKSLSFDSNKYPKMFNFSVKVFESTSGFYLCSRWVLEVNGTFLWCPDIPRLAQRLSRKDIPQDESLLREVFTGMKDATASLFKIGVADQLALVMAVKYRKEVGTILPAILAMKQSLSSFSNFKQLFELSDPSLDCVLKLQQDVVSSAKSNWRKSKSRFR